MYRRPDVRKSFPLENGDRAEVEASECGAIGCNWYSKSAPMDRPHVGVRASEDGYTITFTHSRGDTFCVDVAGASGVWAEACARFLERHEGIAGS